MVTARLRHGYLIAPAVSLPKNLISIARIDACPASSFEIWSSIRHFSESWTLGLKLEDYDSAYPSIDYD